MKEIIHLRIRNRKIEHSTHTVYMLCPADAEVIPNLVLLVLLYSTKLFMVNFTYHISIF